MNRKEVSDFITQNNFDVQSARACFYVMDAVYSAYADSEKIHKSKYSPIIFYLTPDNLQLFYQILPKKYMKKLSNKIYSDYQKNSKNLESLIAGHLGVTKKIDALFNQYYNENELNEKIILKYFSKINKLFYLWWQYGIIGEDKGEIIDSEIVPKFQKRHNLNYEKAKEIINELSHPDELTFFNQERILFLKICLSIGKKDIQKYITEYLKKFFWIGTDFYQAKLITEKSLIEDAIREIKTKGEKKIKEELENITRGNINRLQNKTKIKESIKLNQEDRADLKFCEKIVSWFDLRKFIYMGHFYHIFAMLKEIAKRHKIDYYMLSFYSTKEIEELLDSGKKVSKSLLQKRQGSVFCIYNYGNINKKNYIYGKEGKKLFDIIAKKFLSNFVSGVVASKSKEKIVFGRVRIIINPKNEKFKSGEILVTSMTRIEFVPLMRNAKAIITNEGGMACHAAIVSRELGIPAIIGTKNATQILKDGDQVEMNMQTGEIRIIKK